MTKVSKHNNSNLLLMIPLVLLFFIPPYISGLFFERQWLYYQVAVGVLAGVFLLVKSYDKEKSKFTFLDLTTLALVLCYGISLLVAVNTRGAISETLKVSTYFIIYIIVSRVVSSELDVTNILRAFYWSSIGVLLASFGAAFGTIKLAYAFVDGRLYSTLQYPNTFAVFTICSIIIGLYLWARTESLTWKIIYSVTMFLLFAGFFATGSRGALLTFVPVLLIYFIFAPMRFKLISVLKTGFFGVVSYLWVVKVFYQIPKHSQLYLWGTLVLMCVIAVLPDLLSLMIQKASISQRTIKISSVAVTAVVIIVAAAVLINSNIAATVAKQASQAGGKHFLDISSSSTSAQQRIAFYKDALKIAKDYPVIGTGGRGWDALYRKYQEFTYGASEIHSHFLQVWVETGTFGLMVFVLIWVAVIVTAWKLLRSIAEDEKRHSVVSVFCAALALGIHSMLDFNLSIPAMSILLWALFGLLSGLGRLEGIGDSLAHNGLGLSRKTLKPLTLAFVGVFVVLSAVQIITLSYGGKGGTELTIRRYTAATQDLGTAVTINPLASNYLAGLAEAHMFIANDKESAADLELALKYINRAIALEPYNPDYKLIKGKTLMISGKVDQGVQEFEKAEKLCPFQQKYADRLEDTYYAVGKYYYLNRDKQKAQEYLNKAVSFPEQIAARANNIPAKYKPLQLWEVKLEKTKFMDDAKTAAQKLLTKI